MENKNLIKDPLLVIEIMKNISEGIYLIRLEDSVIVSANERFEKMFGYEPGEMIGKNVSIVNAPSDKTSEEIKKAIVDILVKDGEWHGDIENIKKDGTRFWCHASASLFEYSEYGKVIVSVHTDITENKKREKQAASLNEQLNTVLDAAPSMIFYKDKENRFLRVNESLARANNKTKQEMEGKTCWDLFPKEEADKYWEDDKAVISSGKSKLNIVESMETPSGTKWVQTDKILYRDPNGEVVGVIGFTSDITYRKQAEEEINKKIEEIGKMSDLAVGRELKMIEIKAELEKLKDHKEL